MKLLLNYPLNLTSTQRQQLAVAWPGLEVVERPSGPLRDEEGKDVVAIVSDHMPPNLAAWAELRWIQLLSAGANHLMGSAAFQSGLPITTASGTHGVPIAQYVTCTWLMMAHRMTRVLDFQRSHQWPNRISLAGFSVRGLTAGIIGYGSIGRECARQLHALGMRILCVKRNPAARPDPDYNGWPGTGDPEGRLPEAWFAPSQLAEVLPQCDLVVMTAPATRETQGMIGARELARLKPTARMIIISRGGLVDEAALIQALRAGTLAEAAVDCFVEEPLPAGHPYFDVPNVILTPHISGVSDSFAAVVVPLVCENLRRLKSGQPLLNRANPEIGY